MTVRAIPAAALLFLAAAPSEWATAQDENAQNARLEATLVDSSADPTQRRRALYALQDRSALTDALLVRALVDDHHGLAEAAEVVLLYERVPIGAELLKLARTTVFGESRVLAALARKPRPELVDWVLQRWDDRRLPLADRLNAVAALPRDRLTRPMAKLCVTGALDPEPDVQDATFRAAANLTPRLADGLVGEVHRQAMAGTPIEQMIQVMARLSPEGEKQLLGLMAALDGAAQETVAQWLVVRDSAEFWERVRAAVDGDIPLDLHLLARCGKLLDRPARIARVVELLQRDPSDRVRQKAFDALLSAGVYHPAMRAYAFDPTGDPVSRGRLLGKLDPDQLPEEVLKQMLVADDDAVRVSVLKSLARKPLPERLELIVLDLALGTEGQPRSGQVIPEAARAIAVAGSEAAVRTLWASLRSRPRLHIDVVLWMCPKPKPWAQALFLTELHDQRWEAGDPSTEGAPNTEESVREYLRLALARLGDRHLLNELVLEASQRTPWFLRRCRSIVVPGLKQEHVDMLATAVVGETRTRDDDVRTELVRWLASRPDLAVVETLSQVWRTDSSPEAREEALRGLLAGPERHALFERLRQQLAERNAYDQVRDLAYEVVAAMRSPLSAEDLELLARLLLEAPLAQSDAEVARARRFGTGRAGFPLVSAVVDKLRRDPEADPGPAFVAVAAAVTGHSDVHRITRERLMALLRRAAGWPRLLDGLGPPVAALLLTIPDDGELGAGPACLILARDAEVRGDPGAAAEGYRAAARGILRAVDDPWSVRTFLGVADPVAGEHPLAALAARASVCAARQAQAAGDAATAAESLRVAAELGAGDRDTEREIELLWQQVKR